MPARFDVMSITIIILLFIVIATMGYVIQHFVRKKW